MVDSGAVLVEQALSSVRTVSPARRRIVARICRIIGTSEALGLSECRKAGNALMPIHKPAKRHKAMIFRAPYQTGDQAG
jgi:hypothetical protein